VKSAKPGTIVSHNDRRGYVEFLSADEKSAVVRFPSTQGFVFPTMQTIKLSQLKRLQPVAVEEQYEEALF
jgi:hypothetical protein